MSVKTGVAWYDPPSRQPRPTPSPIVLSLHSLSATVRNRLQPAGWAYERSTEGAERWIEPGGQREVRVDEIPGEPGSRVVEAYNGRERILVRCVGDTPPHVVLQTLNLWAVLPAHGGPR